jgi:RNA polymerase sigma factor (sigma-70 family)
MGTSQLRAAVRHIRKLAGGPSSDATDDRELLCRVVERQDEAAFEELVWRHGPIVHDLCRRRLGQDADADDAFQAVFLALARKAGSIRKRQSLESWLYGVAFRVVERVKRDAARRHKHEQRTAGRPAADPAQEVAWRELCAALDAELYVLSETYRAPLILCYFQGRTRDNTARQLGLSVRTLDRRLERGRELLRKRLARRGVCLSAALLVSALAQRAAATALPPALREAALRTAGAAATAGAISARVAALAEAALAGTGAKLKLATALALALCTTGVSAGLLWQQAGERPAVSPPARRAAPPPVRTDRYGDPLPAEAVARLGTIRFRSETNYLLAYTPDGKFLVTGGQSAVVLLDAATGKEVRRLGTDLPYYLNAATLSPDGKLIAISSASREGGAAVYETATGRRLCRFSKPGQITRVTCFSPDGRLLATFNGFDTIELHNPATGALLRKLEWQPINSGMDHLETIVFTPDGKTLISAGWDGGAIRFWDVAAGKEVRKLRIAGDGVATLAVSPDGTRLALIALRRLKQDKQTGLMRYGPVHVLDLASGKEVCQLAHPGRVSPGRPSDPHLVAFTPDGKGLLTGGTDDVLRLWNPATGKELHRFDGYRNYLGAIAFTPDGKAVAVAESHNTVRVRDLATGRDLLPPDSHRGTLWAVAAAPDGRTVATASDDGQVIVWEPHSGRPLQRLDGHEGVIRTICYNADGRSLFAISQLAVAPVGGSIHTLRCWDVATGRERWRLEKHPLRPTTLALSANGKMLAAAGTKGVLLLDPATGRRLRTLTMSGDETLSDSWNWVAGLTFSPDDRSLRAWNQKENLFRWDVATGERTRLRFDGFTGLEHRFWHAAVSPDGRLIAFGGFGRYLVLADAATGRVLHRITGSESENLDGAVFALAFSPDGRTLAWGGPMDGVIHLVETATGHERRRLTGHRGRAMSLAFTPDGKGLVSGSDDTTALVWDLLGRPKR